MADTQNDDAILSQFSGGGAADVAAQKTINDQYDPLTVISKKFQMGVNGVANARNAAYMMTLGGGMSDDEELAQLKAGAQKVSTGFSDSAYKAQPWYLRAVDDAAQVIPGIGDTIAQGAVGGATTATANLLTSGGLQAALGKIHPAITAAIGATSFGVGYTAGSVKSIWEQTAGDMYSELRLAGVNRNAAKGLAYTFGSLNAGLEFVGLHTLKGVAGNALSTGARDAIGSTLAHPFVKQIENNMVGRLGLKIGEEVFTETSTEGLQQTSTEVAKAIAGLVEKNNAATFTDWNTATGNIKDAMFQALGASAVLGLGGAAGGYALGRATGKGAKETGNIDPEILNKLGDMKPKEILQAVNEGVRSLPNAWEGKLSNEDTVAYDGQGNPYLKATVNAGPESTTSVKGFTTLDARQKEALKPQDSQTTDITGRISNAIDNVGQMKLLDVVNNPDAIIQEGLQAIYPEETPPVTQDQIDSQQLRLPLQDWRPLNSTETQARINQIHSDMSVLQKETNRLESEIKLKEQTGQSFKNLHDRWNKVGQTMDALQSERDVLESGLGTTDIQGPKFGKLRIKQLTKLFDKLDAQTQKLSQIPDIKQQALDLGFNKGQRTKEQSIRRMQMDLKNVVNAVTEDRSIREKVSKYINGVTTPEQMQKAIASIREQALNFETKKINDEQTKQRVALYDKVVSLVNGAQINTQNGYPSSKLNPELTKKLDILKGFLKSKKSLDVFNAKFLLDYGHLSVEQIPDDAKEAMQLATMAQQLHKGDLLSANVTAGNIAQWILDGKNELAAQREAVKQMRDMETYAFRSSIGVNDERPENWIQLQKQRAQQFASTTQTPFMTFNTLLDFISPKDSEHVITQMLDTTREKAVFEAQQEIATDNMLRFINDHLTSNGIKVDLLQRLREDNNITFAVKYKQSNGLYKTENYSKSQLIDIAMKFKDESLHEALTNTETGNGFTLKGSVTEGESTQEVIDAALDNVDRSMVDGILDFYKDYYASINGAYKAKYNVDLPMRDNYSPVSRHGYKLDTAFSQEGLQLWSILPGSARTRLDSKLAIKFSNPLQAAAHHIDQWEYFRAFSDKLDTIHNFRKDTAIRKFLSESYGSGTVKVVDDFFERFVMNDPIPDSPSDSFWSAMRGDLSRFSLGFKHATSFLTQLTSGTLVWANYNPIHITQGILQTILHPAETEQALRSSAILKSRYKEGSSIELKTALGNQGLFGSTISKLTGYKPETLNRNTYDMWNRFMFAGIIGGDTAVSRIFGGPVYWAERNNGASHLDAITTVERLMEQTQQASDVSQTPQALTNPIVNTLCAMFTQQPMQTYGRALIALRDFQHSSMSVSDWMKLGYKMSMLWLIPGALLGLVRTTPSWLFPPDDNEDRKRSAIYDIAGSAALGPMAGLPIVGDILQAIWFEAARPLIGVDMSQRADFYGKNPLIEALYQNPAKAFQMWSKLTKAQNDTFANDLSQEKYEQLEHKANLATARVATQLTGLPGQFGNVPITLEDRLSAGDFAGAAQALGGWSPGAIKQRESPETSPLSGISGGLNPRDSVYDTVSDFFSNVLPKQKPQNNNSNDVVSEFMKAITGGK